MSKRWDIKGYKRKLKRAKRAIVKKAARDAVNHFRGSFTKQGFNDSPFKGWTRLRRKTLSRKKGKLTLIESGKLLASIKSTIKTFRLIKIVSNLTYSSTHNKGDSSKNIPRRQFMGTSKLLTRKITNIIDREIKKIFR